MRNLLDVEQTPVGSKADLPQSRQVLQSLSNSEIASVVDCSLGAERASLLVILLDTRVLVIDVEGRNNSIGDYARAEPTGSPLADLAIKDELHLAGAADVQVLPDHLFKEHPACHRAVQHLGQRKLGLQDRDLIAIASLAVRRGERMRQFPQ